MKNNHVKNLYLHIGMLKTATSSIQDTLYANRDILMKSDFFYSGYFPKNHSSNFIRLFSDSPEKHHINIKHGIDAQEIATINAENTRIFNQEINECNCSNIIYSAETVSLMTLPELEKIKFFFRDLVPSANIRILISTRNPIDFISSFIQETTRTNNGIKVEFHDVFNLQQILTVFGKENVFAYKFEDACQNKYGPVGYFLDLIGLSTDQIANFNIIKSNERLSDKAVNILEFIDEKIPMIVNNKVSRGRIHLDYTHFYGLSGEKFKLTKDYFDESVDMEKLSGSCKWLKENMGIEYSLKDIPSEPVQIVYDHVFSNEIKSIYTFLTPVLKKITLEYVKEKIQIPNIDSLSHKTLTQLLEWIISNHSDIEEHDLSSIINSQRAAISIDKKHRNQLLKRFKSDQIKPGQFYRDIALFLEHYEMIEESLYFMSKAKMYLPNVKAINEHIEKYTAIKDEPYK